MTWGIQVLSHLILEANTYVTNSVTFSLQTNHAERVTSACRQSKQQFLWVRIVHATGPHGRVNLGFPGRAATSSFKYPRSFLQEAKWTTFQAHYLSEHL
jgi:hypothetical protein